MTKKARPPARSGRGGFGAECWRAATSTPTAEETRRGAASPATDHRSPTRWKKNISIESRSAPHAAATPMRPANGSLRTPAKIQLTNPRRGRAANARRKRITVTASAGTGNRRQSRDEGEPESSRPAPYTAT